MEETISEKGIKSSIVASEIRAGKGIKVLAGADGDAEKSIGEVLVHMDAKGDIGREGIWWGWGLGGCAG